MAGDPLLTERIYFDPPTLYEIPETWWARYSAQLQGLSATARLALEADCRYIVHRGVLAADTNEPSAWPQGRTRTGLVMGSVQSGKTASMLGVSALSIDHGVDVVVVLAGTRLSLWRQTYERLAEQLDPGEESVEKAARRLLIPVARVAQSDDSYQLIDTYRLVPGAVRRKLKQDKPLIVVAMKQPNHLHALSETLQASLFPAVQELGRPVHMLVLDDEADDGSVLDAVVETGQDPIFGHLKQVPRAIANLWDPPAASPDNLFTTYIAYTATPQANLLQEDHNPLAPRDFLVSLRTPLDIGYPIDVHSPGNLRSPRTSTYPEPAGLPAFYTGGEVFYRRGADAGLCVPTAGSPDHDLGEAIRAFLVAGAIRLHRSGKAGPATAASSLFETAAEASEAVMPPHSMLFHPSANIADQFRAAEDVLIWAGVDDRPSARDLLDSGDARLPAALAATINAEPGPWKVWLDRYSASTGAIESEFSVLNPASIPNWDDIKPLLINEIIPGTRVAVVNSDGAADDRPEFRPRLDETKGSWRSARDLSTIFASGNVE